MERDSVTAALARLEAAAARIEAAAAQPRANSAPTTAANAQLAIKHETLRETTSAALRDLDALIGKLEG